MSTSLTQQRPPDVSFAPEAYLRRIGHVGGREPDVATLRAIEARHARAIAFESLDPFLGRPVRLDAASLTSKLVHGGRGGYCFEQNLLLTHALPTLGYRTAPSSAPGSREIHTL